MRLTITACVALLGFASAPAGAPAAGSALTGRLTGFPEPSKQVLVYVEAVSLRSGTVAAVTVPAGGRYTMAVPRGPYLVVARASDVRTGQEVSKTSPAILVGSSRRTVNLLARSASDPSARAAATGGATVGIGQIPVSVSTPGYAPTGHAEDAIINGLLPSCQSRGAKLIDQTPVVRNAIKTEQQLSDEGRTEVRFQLQPLKPDLVLDGGINIDANGKPVADFKLVDPKTGKTLEHIIVPGEIGEIDDLGPFYRQLGKGLGARACDVRKKPRRPRPPRKNPRCQGLGPQTLCFTFDGSGSAQNSGYPYSSLEATGSETWHMVWKVPLQRLRTSGSWPPQSGSSAFGHVNAKYDQSVPNPHPDCNTDMHFDPAQTAVNLTNSFSYEGGSDRHALLLVSTAPMFEIGASGSCPGYSGSTDAETQVLHPPAGFNTANFEQFDFHFRDLPGTYKHTYTTGEHEFAGGGYHGSWSGTMTVVVGR